MGSEMKTIFRLLTALCGAATAFFGFHGARLVYAAATFEGEGSLGHVGMYIAAGLFPLLAFFFGGCTWLAWRRARTAGGRSNRSP